MGKILSDATLTVNDDVIAYVPDTLKVAPGLGERTVVGASLGGGARKQMYSENPANAFSRTTFDIHTTTEHIEKIREWALNENRNVVGVTAPSSEGNLQQTMTQCTLTNDYELEFAPEGKITAEFMGNTAV